MKLHRSLTILFLLLTGFISASAQRPGPEFWRKVTCEPFEPRTTLEALEDKQTTVVLKGFTRITTLEIRGIRVDAVEMREMGNVARAKGVAIVLREGSGRERDNRAFLDYDEIDPLISAIDVLNRVDETSTKLAGFEARYRTRGDFEMRVFRQTARGTALLLQTGLCEPATQTLSLDDLAKLKAMILEAKQRLDDLR